VIAIVVTIIVIVLVVTMVTWQFWWPSWRRADGPRTGWWSARTMRIKHAAARDVAAVRQDAKLVRPDAPGNHQDDL
jgi:hypothetical protein